MSYRPCVCNIFPHYDKTERNLFHLISFYSSDLPTAVKTTKSTSVFHSFHTVYDKMSVFTPWGDLSTPLKKVNILPVKKTPFLTFSPRSVIFVIFTIYPIFTKWQFSPFLHDYGKQPKIPLFPKYPKMPKMGISGKCPKMAKIGKSWKMAFLGGSPKMTKIRVYPQNAQKCQKWGFPGNTQKWQFWCGDGDDPLGRLMQEELWNKLLGVLSIFF